MLKELQFTCSSKVRITYPDPEELSNLLMVRSKSKWMSLGTDLDPELNSEHLGTLLPSRCFELVHVLLEKHLGLSVMKKLLLFPSEIMVISLDYLGSVFWSSFSLSSECPVDLHKNNCRLIVSKTRKKLDLVQSLSCASGVQLTLFRLGLDYKFIRNSEKLPQKGKYSVLLYWILI